MSCYMFLIHYKRTGPVLKLKSIIMLLSTHEQRTDIVLYKDVHEFNSGIYKNDTMNEIPHFLFFVVLLSLRKLSQYKNMYALFTIFLSISVKYQYWIQTLLYSRLELDYGVNYKAVCNQTQHVSAFRCWCWILGTERTPETSAVC